MVAHTERTFEESTRVMRANIPVGIGTDALFGSQTPLHWHAWLPGMGPWQSPHEVPLWMTASNAHRSGLWELKLLDLRCVSQDAALNCKYTVKIDHNAEGKSLGAGDVYTYVLA